MRDSQPHPSYGVGLLFCMRLDVRIRTGIYWDASGIQRDCVIIEFMGDLADVIDLETRESIADPAAAIATDEET